MSAVEAKLSDLVSPDALTNKPLFESAGVVSEMNALLMGIADVGPFVRIKTGIAPGRLAEWVENYNAIPEGDSRLRIDARLNSLILCLGGETCENAAAKLIATMPEEQRISVRSADSLYWA